VPGSVDYLFSLFGFLFEAAFVVCLVRQKAFGRYFTLGLYMLSSFVLSLGRYFILFRYGYTSDPYFYFYYFSDAFLTICLYLVLMSLFQTVLEDMGIRRHLRVAALLLMAGTAWFSYMVVIRVATNPSLSWKMLTRFVVEMSQNLYFVGVVLAWLLWGAMAKMRENRTRLIQVVLALGVYFSAFAANYAFRDLYPQFRMIWAAVPPIMGVGLPLAWFVTFIRIPEEARLATARVVPASKDARAVAAVKYR
jgi:hypothetical protein